MENKFSIIIQRKEKNAPWWNTDCQIAIKRKKQALNIFKKNPSVDNLIAFRKARSKAQYLIKQAKQNLSTSPDLPVTNSNQPLPNEDLNLLPEDSKCTFIPPLPDDSTVPPPPPDDPEDGEIMDVTSSSCEKSMDETDSLPASGKEEKVDPNSEFTDVSHGRVKSIELGTPALKIHSPFRRLPPPEAFRKDISDVINFENLPDSTGAYEKLKDVLKNVRSKLSHIKDNKMNNTI